MNSRKGIILAGGSGTRLYPATISVSKQLMPIYDKPMIYYPLASLMSGGIKEVLIITRPEDEDLFIRLLGDGSHLGMSIRYATQPKPEGLAQALIIAEEFLTGSPSIMILGDNLFHGADLPEMIRNACRNAQATTAFAYEVSNASAYGVFEFDERTKQVIGIIEKPVNPPSNYASVGLYCFEADAPAVAKTLKPSARGELEIVDVLVNSLNRNTLNVEFLDKETAWLDTGTASSMLDASEYVEILERRQNIKIGCIEEIAYKNGWITTHQLDLLANALGKSEYANYLKKTKATI